MDRPWTAELPVGIEIESEDEAKMLSISEARARFDQVEGVPTKKVSRAEIQPKGPPVVPVAPKFQTKAPVPVPEAVHKKVAPPVKKPVGPKPFTRPEMMPPEGVKSPSPRLLKLLLA